MVNLSDTDVTQENLLALLHSCPNLSELNISNCRGAIEAFVEFKKRFDEFTHEKFLESLEMYDLAEYCLTLLLTTLCAEFPTDIFFAGLNISQALRNSCILNFWLFIAIHP